MAFQKKPKGPAIQEPSKPAIQGQVIDPRRIGTNTSGFDDFDVADVLAILYPASPRAVEIVRKTADSRPQHVLSDEPLKIPISVAMQGFHSGASLALLMSSASSLKRPGLGFVFGRQPLLADIVLPSDPDRRISNQHFRIYLDPASGIKIEDLSTNGTMVDHVLLKCRQPSRFERSQVLKSGSVIIVANKNEGEVIKFIVQIPDREFDDWLRYREKRRQFLLECGILGREEEVVDHELRVKAMGEWDTREGVQADQKTASKYTDSTVPSDTTTFPNESSVLSGGVPRTEPGSIGLVHKVYRNLMAIPSHIRWGEHSVPPDHHRIEWVNNYGKRVYDDYIEHEPGALQALQHYLQTTAYQTKTAPQSGHNPQWSRPGFSDTSNNTSSLTPGLQTGTNTDSTRDETSKTKISKNGEDIELGGVQVGTLHLMSCMEKGRYSVELHQELITDIKNDRELFYALRRSYHEHRGKLRRFWSLRTVHSIHFMKFLYAGPHYIDIRTHETLCSPPQPCTCIPPPSLVRPFGQEYECHPHPPKLSPPIGPRLLMDFFTNPSTISPTTTLVIQQLPKRTQGELRAPAFEPADAWGIYYREDWDWGRVWWVMGWAFFPPSLVFGVLWGVLRGDVQGAFGVASWWMMGASILVGVVGTCTWRL